MDVLGLGLLHINNWLIAFVLLIVAAYVYLTWNFDFFEKRGIPGPKPVPLFGSLHTAFISGMHNALVYNARKYGKLYGIFEGPKPALVCSDPDFVKYIFIKSHENFMDRGRPTAKGHISRHMLVSANGEYWKTLRSTITPTFSTGKLKLMIQQLNECGQKMVENMKKEAKSGSDFECREYTGAFTLDAIATAAFGLHLDSLKDKDNHFLKMAKTTNSLSLPRPINFISAFLPFLKPVLSLLRIDLAQSKATSFYLKVTEQTMEARNASDGEKRVDLLQLMINAHKESRNDDTEHDQEFHDVHGSTERKGLTKDEVLANGAMFFLAGYDTTAIAISFLMYLLALNPEMQQKLYEEIDEILGDKELDYNLLCEMKFLDMCVQESLRIFPPAVRTSRLCTKATTINEIEIPEGMRVVVPIYAIHHDPKIWWEPEKFNPYRFAKEEKSKHSAYDWLPFGSGPPNCVAMRLALTEIKVATVHILKHYKLLRSYKTEVPLVLTATGLLKATNGIWMKIEER